MNKNDEALKIIVDGLKELESAKGSVTVGVQKLSRAAKLLDNKEIIAWTEIQFATPKYIEPLRKFSQKVQDAYAKENKIQNIADKKFSKELKTLIDLSIPLEEITELHRLKTSPASGGFHSIDFIEE